jgi:hypothetical protein
MVTQAQYEYALAQAHNEKLEITLLESEMAHVHNPNNGPTGFYTVRFPKGCHVMTCNCKAGQVGTYCKHRAIVHAERVHNIQQRAAKAQAQPRITDRGWREQYARQAIIEYDLSDRHAATVAAETRGWSPR